MMDDDDDDFQLIESESSDSGKGRADDTEIDKLTVDSKEDEMVKHMELTATVLASILNFIVMLRQSSITVAKAVNMRESLLK